MKGRDLSLWLAGFQVFRQSRLSLLQVLYQTKYTFMESEQGIQITNLLHNKYRDGPRFLTLAFTLYKYVCSRLHVLIGRLGCTIPLLHTNSHISARGSRPLCWLRRASSRFPALRVFRISGFGKPTNRSYTTAPPYS